MNMNELRKRIHTMQEVNAFVSSYLICISADSGIVFC